MCGKTHKVGGLCLGIITGSLLLHPPFTINKIILACILIIWAIIGSLLPDIDHQGSTISKKRSFSVTLNKLMSKNRFLQQGILKIVFCPIFIIMALFICIISLLLSFLSKIITNLFEHRGITHAPVTYIVISLLLAVFIPTFSGFSQYVYICSLIGVFVGAISHILMDSLTVDGTPWFYPLSKKKYRILKLRTGHGEIFVSITCFILTFLFVYNLFK